MIVNLMLSGKLKGVDLTDAEEKAICDASTRIVFALLDAVDVAERRETKRICNPHVRDAVSGICECWHKIIGDLDSKFTGFDSKLNLNEFYPQIILLKRIDDIQEAYSAALSRHIAEIRRLSEEIEDENYHKECAYVDAQERAWRAK